jgi:hypothetical protein
MSTCKERSTVRKVMAAAHWSFNMSRQMAPVTLEMLGCQILVTNLPTRLIRAQSVANPMIVSNNASDA